MRAFVVLASGDSDEENNDPYDYALVVLKPSDAAGLLRCMDFIAAETPVFEVNRYDTTVRFFQIDDRVTDDAHPLSTALDQLSNHEFSDGTFAEVTAEDYVSLKLEHGQGIPGEYKVESTWTRINEYKVQWVGFRDSARVDVSTFGVPRSVLEDVARGAQA